MTAAAELDPTVSRLADELLFTTPAVDALVELEEQGARAERLTRFAAAMQVQARVAQWHAHSALGQAEWAAASIAVVEECSVRTVEARLGWSITLHDDLPVTWSLLREGHLPLASARTVAEQAVLLTHDQCQVLEERLWPDGEDTIPTTTGRLPAALAEKCARWIPRIHTGDTTHLTVARARAERDVWLEAGQPGTDLCTLRAPLTVPDGEAVLAELNAIADHASPTDPRTRGMLRADALVEKITGQASFALWADQHSADTGSTTPLPTAPHWQVSVTVPLDVITAGGTDPGRIGRTVVTSTTARALAQAAISAGGRIHRLVTDPLTGVLLDLSTLRQQRPTTRPPADGPPHGAPPTPGPPDDSPPPSDTPTSSAPLDGPEPTTQPATPARPPALTPTGGAPDRPLTATTLAQLATTLDHALAGGQVASIGTRIEPHYEPSNALARYVRARDQHCQHPGCRVPATRCDLDHTIPHDQGGPTTAVNLAALCRHHHRLKHQAGWTLHRTTDSALHWTTPTGRTLRAEPASLL